MRWPTPPRRHAGGDERAAEAAELRIEGLAAAYGSLRVLHEVTIEVQPGEAVALLGANGAGKTTLLRTISGLHPPLAGRVSFAGVDITGVRPDRILRAGLAHVPEGRQVFAEQTVAENLLLGGRLRRDAKGLASDREYVLDVFPALAQRLGEPAGNLSGGQQQALSIARALMARPKLLVLDEPTLGLAPRLVDDLGDLLRRLRSDWDMGMLIVEQDTFLALELTERAYVMQRGRITLEKLSAALLGDPDVVMAYLGGDGADKQAATETPSIAVAGSQGHDTDSGSDKET
jgi:branched-chain amino acid transport system ATP-binding protein